MVNEQVSSISAEKETAIQIYVEFLSDQYQAMIKQPLSSDQAQEVNLSDLLRLMISTPETVKGLNQKVLKTCPDSSADSFSFLGNPDFYDEVIVATKLEIGKDLNIVRVNEFQERAGDVIH